MKELLSFDSVDAIETKKELQALKELAKIAAIEKSIKQEAEAEAKEKAKVEEIKNFFKAKSASR